MTLVSKNGLSFIDLFAIEFEIRRKGPLHLTELLECPLFGPVTGHLEIAFTCNGDLDFVSLFEIESFDDYSGKTYSQTVAPLGNLHKRYTYYIVYPHELGSNPWPKVLKTAQKREKQLQMGLDTYGFVASRSPVRSRRVAPYFL